MTINDRITSFKSDILHGKLSYEEILQKHLIGGPSYFFHDLTNNPQAETKVKEQISKSFDISMSDVIVVGSGKLGFSLSPKNYFRKFDEYYNVTHLNRDRSDIDIAIVSPDLYNYIGEMMYNYTEAYDNKWYENEYYPIEKLKKNFAYLYAISTLNTSPKGGFDRI